MLPLGTPLPVFELSMVPGISGELTSTSGALHSKMFQKKPLLIMILCAHCPFVKHVESELTKLDRDYLGKVDFLAISSNSTKTHPQDGPEHLLAQSMNQGWRFPYLLDLDQSFAKSLRAACTPDFFLFAPENGQQRLRYRGQLDGSRPGNKIETNGIDLRLAMDAVLKKRIVSSDQQPSIGCNIKWETGNEPSWFG